MKKQLLILTFLCCCAVIVQTQSDVPAYFEKPPAQATAVLTQQQLAANGADHPAVIAAYKAVAKMPAVIYQLPCYCYCDRHHGHKSLHSCFESMHGANCGTCVQEVLYAYQMQKKGWTAKQIRDGIERGEYKTIDLQNPPAV